MIIFFSFLEKQSKRVSARKKYKIEKKVREHNRKIRKEKKKHPEGKRKITQIPNQCPFKEDILKEAEALRKQKEEEKQKRREEMLAEKRKKLAGGIESLVENAANKLEEHESTTNSKTCQSSFQTMKDENSLKTYFKIFQKVVDLADVILEVVDARDPLGTRCEQVENAVNSSKGIKKLVLVLNKADLVPRENLDQWLKYLRGSLPAVAFKASTQDQSRNLGHRKLASKKESMIQNSACYGAELIMKLLGNYCRDLNGVKKSITVGIVGLPNVGKSSVINSLKRNKVCNVGNLPGITKSMQIVQLDSKIKLLDSPGIVFAESNQDEDYNSSIALKNAIKIQSLKDPITPASIILKRIPHEKVIELYDIGDFSTPEEFFAIKAKRMGMLKKKGIPDSVAAACSLLNDWNSGKIRYCTLPPETPFTNESVEIVKQVGGEFDITKYEKEEKMLLESLDNMAEENKLANMNSVSLSSANSDETASNSQKKIIKLQKINEKVKNNSVTSNKNVQIKKGKDLFSETEGNQQLNKLNKLYFKKQKKEKVKREKQTTKLADQLENFSMGDGSDNYNFDTDFNMDK
ncbi:GSCOCG00009932001-RA-CDS [Cotesia congregata]|uniref:Guanine nucleotide-binding protein-like 3 homolog n=1 Tax=Cotesia congregata TaxID=51543 RepID=A0A8J2HQC4_COTCN|nr:GSCOCG00009932001-RA-CDS [Cotesia congregata]CAG5102720.1 Similar to Ns1: Guanine nucleotide-binding protein-like 3 homolog (Drosophila melanogaster) [Cotesia congregata]